MKFDGNGRLIFHNLAIVDEAEAESWPSCMAGWDWRPVGYL
jgi:hypothetical protein